MHNYPVAKLYAYRQKISGGANFSANEKNSEKSAKHIYLLVKQNRTIEIEQVWIDNKPVTFKAEIVNSPITQKTGLSFSGKGPATTLVPATTHTVLQLFVDDMAVTNNEVAPQRYKKYPLLIQYSEAGELYFLGAKNWQLLAPAVKQ